MFALQQRSKADGPPEPLRMMPEGIPLALKTRPQWVGWKYAWDGKKWTKHPYNPRTGRKASSTDLMTWTPFADVLATYKAGGYDGAGFVFCSGDPYCGVDLDKCVDSETGEIEPWAAEIVETLDSYTEFSPSGTGLHIIVKGEIPSNSKKGRIEMYSTKRFFTMTGHSLSEGQ